MKYKKIIAGVMGSKSGEIWILCHIIHILHLEKGVATTKKDILHYFLAAV